MVAVVQLVEHLVVVQDVAGSSPVSHPPGKPRSLEVTGLSLEYAESSPVASGELVFDLTDRVLRKKVGCLFEQDARRHVR